MIQHQIFAGMRNAVHPHNLPENNAVLAVNTELSDSGVEGVRGDAIIAGTGGSKAFIRVEGNIVSSSRDISLMRFPNRNGLYIYSDNESGGLRWGRIQSALSVDAHTVSEPISSVAPVATSAPSYAINSVTPPSANDRSVHTSLCYAYVGTLGIDGLPSPPTDTFRIRVGADNLTVMLPPAPTGATSVIVYAAINGDWIAIAERPASETVININPFLESPVPVAGSVVGTTLDIYGYAPMPAVKGVAMTANGVFCGYINDSGDSSSTIYFSAPWLPHIQNPLTAISVVGRVIRIISLPEGLLVLTNTEPYIITGDLPERFVAHRIESRYPALSYAGVCVYRGMCIWSTHDGVAGYGGGNIRLLSSAVIDADWWRGLNPTQMILGEHRGVIYCVPPNGRAVCYRLEQQDFYLRDMPRVLSFYQDEENDELLYGFGGVVFLVGSGRRMDYEWVGKPRITGSVPFSSGRVISTGTCSLVVLADGSETGAYRVRVADEFPFRVNTTGRARNVQIGVRGGSDSHVRMISLSADMRELF